MDDETWDSPYSYHEHQCRTCPNGIICRQTDEECDKNGGIGQYGGQCDDCHRKERVAALVARIGNGSQYPL